MKHLNKTFFDEVKKFFPITDPVQVEVLNGIWDRATGTYKALDIEIAYMMSTGVHESKLRPVREGFYKTDAGARRYVKRQGYPYAKVVNGHVFYGRSIVQLTHDYNYIARGKDLGVDFYNYPDLALEIKYAVPLLVDGMLKGWYNGRGKGLGYYLNRPVPDWENARRTVNITDKWQKFRNTAIKFQHAIKKARQAKAKRDGALGGGLGAGVGTAVLPLFGVEMGNIVFFGLLITLGLLGYGFYKHQKEKYKEHDIV